MLLKTILFLFSFIPAALIAQIEDSIITDKTNYINDSSAVSIVDSLGYESDSVYTEVVNYVTDSSTAHAADSIGNIIEPLVISSEEVRSYLYHKPFSYQSTFIDKTDILRNDYRYTGDLFIVFPFSFERSYGFVGQPNDIYLYAEGSTSTNYFTDGVPVSNALFYPLDFNHIQSEDIDSIEIIPLPRGFLYGFTTNPVSVNFISKDINSLKPYSRIKYYEGAFGEAFIDGIFNMYLFKDLNASVDVTNRKVDNSFKNTEFSIWQIKTRLRYNLSNYLNVFGSYYFSKSITGINGGVNVDRILQITPNINSLLFNETRAPVYFENNSLDSKQHNFGLKVLAKAFENSYTNLNFYYKFYQNECNAADTLVKSKSTSKDKILGALLDQRFTFDPIQLYLQSGYQSLKHSSTFTSSDSLDAGYLLDNSPLDYKSFFISPLLSVTLFDSTVVPSVYYKYANILQKNSVSGIETKQKYTGFGADLAVYLNESFNLYLGYSQFDNDYFIGEKINALELRLGYKDENGNFTIDLFNKKTSAANLWGAGVDVSYSVWKMLLEGRLSQYFVGKNSLVEFMNIPETKFNVGIYFKDTLFSNNLDLKAGFVANYIGRQNLRNFSIPYLGTSSADVESWITVDFTMSAQIQKVAIVYFTWENLFDWMYYITPYYPMLERNIRFGVAWEIFN